MVVGGGITGAGIALEAARAGYKVLLVEQRDFAWGTSSRSSKLIHGGLRYLRQGQLHLTRESVSERLQLLRQAPGLVEPQSFALADYAGSKPGRWMYALGLAVYNLLAGLKGQGYQRAHEFLMLAPHIAGKALRGGQCYQDAKTDDARLVLRVLQEAQEHGATIFNYVRVSGVPEADGQGIVTVTLEDAVAGAPLRTRTQLVINATGAWGDSLRRPQDLAPRRRLRPLRGSHLIFPAWRLPVAQAVSLMHPDDGRPVFAFPWEGVTLVGTTDVDHRQDMATEACITGAEVAYLMRALDTQFPSLALELDDVVATYAGVRPVVDSGHADPSSETRDHAIWLEHGVLTVAGGKLTTFRLIAQDALAQARKVLPAPGVRVRRGSGPIFNPVAPLPAVSRLPASQRERLAGRYGAHAHALVACARSTDELDTIAGTDTIWAQLRWSARMEAVVHLEDLLLRRTRLGLQLRAGGAAHMPRIRAICQHELGWSDAQWEREQHAYMQLWRSRHGMPAPAEVPAWRGQAR
ncbi:MAG TPA: glycerol-3-phosphate dehydrogenase/oxidase [Burkholderiaceae bacterium]